LWALAGSFTVRAADPLLPLAAMMTAPASKGPVCRRRDAARLAAVTLHLGDNHPVQGRDGGRESVHRGSPIEERGRVRQQPGDDLDPEHHEVDARDNLKGPPLPRGDRVNRATGAHCPECVRPSGGPRGPSLRGLTSGAAGTDRSASADRAVADRRARPDRRLRRH
jgi:hypothetical protein